MSCRREEDDMLAALRYVKKLRVSSWLNLKFSVAYVAL